MKNATGTKRFQEQSKKLNEAIDEISTPKFWKEIGPGLELKFRNAANYIFSRGIEYGMDTLTENILDDMQRMQEKENEKKSKNTNTLR